jgi:hypothetical protein
MKGSARLINEAGLEILKSRPRKSTVAFLKALAAGIDEDQQQTVADVLNAIVEAESRTP